MSVDRPDSRCGHVGGVITNGKRGDSRAAWTAAAFCIRPKLRSIQRRCAWRTTAESVGDTRIGVQPPPDVYWPWAKSWVDRVSGRRAADNRPVLGHLCTNRRSDTGFEQYVTRAVRTSRREDWAWRVGEVGGRDGGRGGRGACDVGASGGPGCLEANSTSNHDDHGTSALGMCEAVCRTLACVHCVC